MLIPLDVWTFLHSIGSTVFSLSLSMKTEICVESNEGRRIKVFYGLPAIKKVELDPFVVFYIVRITDKVYSESRWEKCEFFY